MYENELVGS